MKNLHGFKDYCKTRTYTNQRPGQVLINLLTQYDLDALEYIITQHQDPDSAYYLSCDPYNQDKLIPVFWQVLEEYYSAPR